MKARVTLRTALGWPLFGISLLAAFVVMALPSGTLSWLRRTYQPLSRAMSWLEHRGAFLDLDHVAFFVLLAFAWGLLAPASRRWWMALCLPVLAVVTELMQFHVPGREPRLTDVRDDILGAAVGWALAMALLWLGRWIAAAIRARKKLPEDA